MVDELDENTEENPGEKIPEGETPEKTPEEGEPINTPEEKKTPKEKTESPKGEYSDREKRYYARMKDAEETAKKAKDELAKSKRPVSDIDAILEVQQATKGLSLEEVAELKVRSTATGKSLTESRKDENFVLWQKAYKEKVEKENSALPETKQGEIEKEKPVSEMTLDEKNEYYAKQGFVKAFPKAKPL